MFVRSNYIHYLLSTLFVFAMGACSGAGGCSACGSSGPLPTGGLPADQTIEGGAQIRVTPEGFSKLTSLLPGLVDSALNSGPICIPGNSFSASVFGYTLASASYCEENSGPTCTNGCLLNIALNTNGTSTQVVGNQLQVDVSTNLATSIHLDFQFLGADIGNCDLGVSSSNLNGSLDIGMGIQAPNGELALSSSINSFGLNLTFTGCGVLSDLATITTQLIDAIGPAIQGLLSPAIDLLVQSFLPNPLGIASMTDVGALLGGISPGTTALMETRIVPGGYVSLEGSGMDLGVITGLNSDSDPTTRTGTRPDGVQFASEPNLCVPPLPISNFGAPPFNLPTIVRSALTNGSAFTLLPAGDFTSTNDGANPPDIKMGISQTTLNLAGHHIVTSGAACLDIGTSTISELNVGTIAILVPSLAPLEDEQGNDPLLLVTRPQRAITFLVGDNTPTSPALTIGLSHFQVDFYAFLYQRYTRVFTLDLTLNVGLNMEFTTTGGTTTITPTILGVDAADVQLTVLNSEFVKETPQQLEAVLPTIFNLVTPLLGNIPPITVPSFAGFSLSNLSIQHVTTTQDNFLALFATLGAGFEARQLAAIDPLAAAAVAKLDSQVRAPQPASTGTARLVKVNTPAPDVIRGALLQQPGGALPAITFDVDRYDGRGRELEWAWNFNGGLFHPFTSASPLVVSDKAFAWQGKYTIGLQSRVKGDYTTTSAVQEIPVIIDSVGPRVMADKATWNDDDKLAVPVWDVVSGLDVQVAFGRPGTDVPSTAWVYQGDAALARDTWNQLEVDGEVAVFARDEAGNTSQVLIAPFHGTTTGVGCQCNSTGTPTSGSLVLLGLVGLGLTRSRRRRRRWLSPRAARFVTTFTLWAGVSIAASMAPGCSCNNKSESCETTMDCTNCMEGTLPYCIDNMCICNDDIPIGQLGPYSDVAGSPDGSTWVSAYAQSYGDLVVAEVGSDGRIADTAWQWVDGVPAGPVTVPGSMIRGGISDNGPDVGMYTSIAVAADGTPLVTYFDVDRGALKLAAYVAGAWVITDIDVGTGSVAAAGGSIVGMYSSLTLRSDDGRPGVAYLAHVNDGTGVHAEVRYASAQVAVPSGPGDWQTWVVDTAAIPSDPSDIFPLPEGLGLFVASARNPTDQSPVVAYYDRGAGELKLSKLDPSTGNFTAPVVLDGSNGVDVGWTPSVKVDTTGKAHVAYASATNNDLKYTVEGGMPTVIDDGYRIVGTTVDGLPQPQFDFVGANASLALSGAVPYVAYQDATTQELLVGHQLADGTWMHTSIAGNTTPWPGAYGFYAASSLMNGNLIMSSWVIDQPSSQNWVEVFTQSLGSLQ